MAGLMRDHFERVRAAKAARDGAIGAGERVSLRGSLGEMIRARREELHGIRSVTEKEKRKAEFMPSFDAVIEGIMEGGKGRENSSEFGLLMLWQFDAGRLDKAVEMAGFALENGVSAPDEHLRPIEEIIAEETAARVQQDGEWVDGALEKVEVIKDALVGREAKINDRVRAKFAKVNGMLLEEAGRIEEAVSCYELATKLDERSGCVKLANEARKKMTEGE